ncbi:G-protein alpha subunit-domain-containing protein [Mycena amicta]|nr:G-protein alpha subunit-domain-containing protein [Mycena amicta]
MWCSWIRKLIMPGGSESRSKTKTEGTRVRAAAARSNEIDALIKRDKFFFMDRKIVLVLGQEGAGKSTFVRQAKAYSDRTTQIPRSTENVNVNTNTNNLKRPGSAGTGSSSHPSSSKRSSESTTGNLRHPRPRARAVEEIPFAVPVRIHGGNTMTMHTTLVYIRNRQPLGAQRKWLHHFSGSVAEALVFVVDASCYDEWVEVSASDSETGETVTMSRMHLALRDFADLCDSAFPTVIIILNKLDLFANKLSINKIPLTVCFPEYPGASEVSAAAEYCAEQFIRLAKRSPTLSRRVHAFCTCMSMGADMDTKAQLGGQLQTLGEVIYEERIRRALDSEQLVV